MSVIIFNVTKRSRYPTTYNVDCFAGVFGDRGERALRNACTAGYRPPESRCRLQNFNLQRRYLYNSYHDFLQIRPQLLLKSVATSMTQ